MLTAAGAVVTELVLVLMIGGAFAQTGSEVIRRATEGIQRGEPVTPAPRRNTEPVPEGPFCSTLAARGLADKPLAITAVTFVDQNEEALGPETNLPLDDFRALAVANTGDGKTYQTVCGILQKSKQILRDQGYVFTRVSRVLPSFDDDKASIRVSILSVVIAAVEVVEPEGEVGGVKNLIESYVGRLAGLQNPTIKDIERVSLMTTDIPGVTRAMLVPSRGDMPGAINLSMQVERDPFHGFFLLNNEESPTVGPGLVGLVGSINSYTRFGDTTQLSAFNSFDFDGSPFVDLTERTTLRLDHQSFWGGNGLRFEASALVSWSAPGNELEPLEMDGYEHTFTAGLSYPVLRTRRLSFWARAGVEWDDNTIDVSDGAARITDDSLRVGVIGGRLVQRDRFGATTVDLSVRQGFDIFGATSDSDPDKSRADGSAVFTSIRGEITRDLALAEVIPSIHEGLSLHGRIKFQWAADPVLSYEEFYIGGDYVRGYEPSEGRGDRGIAGYGELRLTRYEENSLFDAELQLYGFFDIGRVENLDRGLPANKTLASGGGGFRMRVPQGPRLQVEAAMPLSDDRRARDNQRSARFLANLIWVF